MVYPSNCARSVTKFCSQHTQDLMKASAIDKMTSVEAVQHYLNRISQIDQQGPKLHSIVELNPDALAIAATLDAEKCEGKVRGPLHGVPIVVKDNIATGDKMSTTAGSLVLEGVRATHDAHLIGRLRDAGAVILGKTNLSEWANFRSSHSICGWSGRGGQTLNPYALDRTPAGSSSGSAVAVAAGLAAMAVGTETDGSIVVPASFNGLVGLKPTVGCISRRGCIPTTNTQDTPGPMACTVRDAAILLDAMAGRDENDHATLNNNTHNSFLQSLNKDALRGARIGVSRSHFTGKDKIDKRIECALEQLRLLGAELIDPIHIPGGHIEEEITVMLHEIKHYLPLYFTEYAPHAPVRTLADIIAFNEAHKEQEMPYFNQDLLIQAEVSGNLDSKAYLEALATCRKRSQDDGIDHVIHEHQLDAIVAPTNTAIPPLDNRDFKDDYVWIHVQAAVAGYPHLTVPAGLVDGLPVGLSFIGTAWSDARLLGFGYAFEQATQWRKEPAISSV
jgi:amidase